MTKTPNKAKPIFVSAESAANEFKRAIDDWLEDYKKQHAESPEMYPMNLRYENSGLWGEFIYDFYNNRS